jgi:hypothetical protein
VRIAWKRYPSWSVKRQLRSGCGRSRRTINLQPLGPGGQINHVSDLTGPPRVNARDPTVCICRRPPDEPNRPVPHPHSFLPGCSTNVALSVCALADGRGRATWVMTEPRCCSRWCRRRAPPHARNAPSSRPNGNGDKRKALPYAQLLSQVPGQRRRQSSEAQSPLRWRRLRAQPASTGRSAPSASSR